MTNNKTEYFSEALQIAYPDLTPDTCAILASKGCHLTIEGGTVLFTSRDHCRGVMWLLEGSVRVHQHSPDAREVTLYRVFPGELCLLSLYTLFHGGHYAAEARAETTVRGITLPPDEVLSLVESLPDLRRYLFRSLTARLQEMVTMVSECVFHHQDTRLACLLARHFERSGGAPLEMTHEVIAREIGTTREVVSRLLKQLELQGGIRLSRGKIELLSGEVLWRLVDTQRG